MGGYVAMAVLRRHPDRVRALVLADTKATADTADAAAGRLRIAERVIEDGNAGVLVDEMLPKLVGTTTKKARPLVLGRVKALVERAPAYAVAWAQRAMAARPDSLGTLREVRVPTLVVVGAEDELSSPADAAAMAEAVPGATLATIPESGHLTAVEMPEAFNEALAGFLASLP
jgi:pimeloyl-ACP methyl ester carboxylesterase